MKRLFQLTFQIALVALMLGGCELAYPPTGDQDHAAGSGREADGHDHDQDDADDHDEDGDEALHDHPEDVDAHAEDADHDAETDAHLHEEGEPDHVELSPAQRQRIGLRLATAQPGTVEVARAFPGEVMLDPDRMAHIVPRAPGIVREVSAGLGDRVEAGQVLAWIESDELAEAKLAFYAKHAEVGCCQVELPRAKAIFENTHRLLAALESEPAAEELRKFEELEMGEYRGRLLSAYSDYLSTRQIFECERSLFEKNISSESEFVQAEAAFKKAQAVFAAARDTARYQVLIAFSEAARQRQVAEFEAVAAEQRLRLRGVDDGVLSGLLALVPQTVGLEPCLCDDPNCKEGEIPSVMDSLGGEERLGWYALRAPFAGFITEKHLTLGEKVNDEESVMVVVDTSSVWIRFSVYQKDLSLIEPGQAVHAELGSGLAAASGVIAYVAPVIDRETRTAQARVELANPDGVLRPGLYANVHVEVEVIEAAVIISKDAVQVLDGEEIVFIEDGDGFRAAPVRLGVSDRDRVIVLSGLEPGQRYVDNGAFELKARIVTSGIDAHAGHGH